MKYLPSTQEPHKMTTKDNRVVMCSIVTIKNINSQEESEEVFRSLYPVVEYIRKPNYDPYIGGYAEIIVEDITP